MNKKVLCPVCGCYFIKKGTSVYCPDKDCYEIEKRNRQKVVDDLVKNIKKGLYANFKLFREKLPESGQIKIDYDIALKKGFDEFAYYGTYVFDSIPWYFVENYYFKIEYKNDNRFLHIFKK